MKLPKFLIRAAMNQITSLRDLSSEQLAELFGTMSKSTGEIVTPATATRLASVYGCCNVLAESLATLPIKLYNKTIKNGDPVEELVTDNRFARTLQRPNPNDTPFDFFERIVWQLALRGQAFAIKNVVMGEVVELLPIDDPSEVMVNENPDWTLSFVYKGKTYSQKQMLYLKMRDGKSILKQQSDTIGRAQAITKYAGSYFKNSALPNLVVSTDATMNKDAADRFKETWDSTFRGAENGNKIAILDQGKKLTPLTVSNEDAQFLETSKYTDTQICGLFRVSPHMIGILDHATFSNIENLGIQFRTYTMTPWCRRIETAITRQCLWDMGQPNSLHCEFNLDGLERGDIKSRYQAYTQAIQAGWMTPNEVRKKENLNKQDDGDRFWIPANMDFQDDHPSRTTGTSTTDQGNENDQNDDRDEREEQEEIHKKGVMS